jgi:hypothetical protein
MKEEVELLVPTRCLKEKQASGLEKTSNCLVRWSVREDGNDERKRMCRKNREIKVEK